ncbi:MAG: hypothetical protein NC391_10670 [Alistipes timonensis]|nr:hypothetical protein [Alistipes timonensis]
MKTLRKIGMMIAVAFVALGFTACDDDDDDAVANASFTGTWKIIENVNITTAVTTPDVLVDAETPAAPVSLTFNADGTGSLNYTALVEEPYDEDGDNVFDGTELVEKEFQGAFTYTSAEGTNGLTTLEITLQPTDQYKDVVMNTSYSIKGDLMYLYLKYPQSPDVLRKQ